MRPIWKAPFAGGAAGGGASPGGAAGPGSAGAAGPGSAGAGEGDGAGAGAGLGFGWAPGSDLARQASAGAATVSTATGEPVEPPLEPRKGASPKAKIPPSAATSQYPAPLGVAAIPTTARARPAARAPPTG